jgi:hypothetical protein
MNLKVKIISTACLFQDRMMSNVQRYFVLIRCCNHSTGAGKSKPFYLFCALVSWWFIETFTKTA